MKQVWVIDDDEEMGRAIGLMLKLLDCDVTLFLMPGPQCKLCSPEKHPHLMIVDINMPEVSGLDLVEFLRRRREWKDMPIVMLSSEAADTMVDKALRYGADSYVTKPVTLEELENAMENAFSKHKIGA